MLRVPRERRPKPRQKASVVRFLSESFFQAVLMSCIVEKANRPRGV